jgi:hypothetical protein
MAPSDAVGSSPTEDAVEATEEHAAAEGVEAESTEGAGSSRNLRKMLMSTDPERRLEEIDSPWDPEAGGETRIYRGIMKMGNFEGMPAIGDLVLGIGEIVAKLNLPEDDGGDDGTDVEDGPIGGRPDA